MFTFQATPKKARELREDKAVIAMSGIFNKDRDYKQSLKLIPLRKRLSNTKTSEIGFYGELPLDMTFKELADIVADYETIFSSIKVNILPKPTE